MVLVTLTMYRVTTGLAVLLVAKKIGWAVVAPDKLVVGDQLYV